MPWLLLLIVLLFLVSLLIIRTINFKPLNFPEMHKTHEIDKKRAVESLSKMLQFKTISSLDSSKVDKKEFSDFRDFLKQRYPKINEIAIYSEHKTAVLYHIKGQSNEEPVVLMSHYDVVPIVSNWKHDPFSGKIDETTVYGRGALDTKSSLNAIMESVEFALNNGKIFKNDLYLAFSGDEEIYGPSAPAIVEYFKSNNIEPAMVLDEGGAIINNIFPGVKKKAAVIGIAEKGFLNLKLIASSKGGHASTPPKNTPVTALAKAVNKLNNHPSFKLKLTPAVKSLFTTIAPHSSSFGIKLLFANIWLFTPIIKLIAKISGGEFLSLFKTTQAFTMASASDALNVLPSNASISVNYRLRYGDTKDIIIKRVEKIIKNKNIKLEVVSYSEATKTSLMGEHYKILTKAISQTWTDVVPSPYLMIAGTDSRYYHEICDHVYKFSPMDITKEDLAKIHGIDEDISIDNVSNGINFYLNLIAQL